MAVYVVYVVQAASTIAMTAEEDFGGLDLLSIYLSIYL
jgi:hypothetical protein